MSSNNEVNLKVGVLLDDSKIGEQLEKAGKNSKLELELKIPDVLIDGLVKPLKEAVAILGEMNQKFDKITNGGIEKVFDNLANKTREISKYPLGMSQEDVDRINSTQEAMKALKDSQRQINKLREQAAKKTGVEKEALEQQAQIAERQHQQLQGQLQSRELITQKGLDELRNIEEKSKAQQAVNEAVTRSKLLSQEAAEIDAEKAAQMKAAGNELVESYAQLVKLREQAVGKSGDELVKAEKLVSAQQDMFNLQLKQADAEGLISQATGERLDRMSEQADISIQAKEATLARKNAEQEVTETAKKQKAIERDIVALNKEKADWNDKINQVRASGKATAEEEAKLYEAHVKTLDRKLKTKTEQLKKMGKISAESLSQLATIDKKAKMQEAQLDLKAKEANLTAEQKQNLDAIIAGQQKIHDLQYQMLTAKGLEKEHLQERLNKEAQIQASLIEQHVTQKTFTDEMGASLAVMGEKHRLRIEDKEVQIIQKELAEEEAKLERQRTEEQKATNADMIEAQKNIFKLRGDLRTASEEESVAIQSQIRHWQSKSDLASGVLKTRNWMTDATREELASMQTAFEFEQARWQTREVAQNRERQAKEDAKQALQQLKDMEQQMSAAQKTASQELIANQKEINRLQLDMVGASENKTVELQRQLNEHAATKNALIEQHAAQGAITTELNNALYALEQQGTARIAVKTATQADAQAQRDANAEKAQANTLLTEHKRIVNEIARVQVQRITASEGERRILDEKLQRLGQQRQSTRDSLVDSRAFTNELREQLKLQTQNANETVRLAQAKHDAKVNAQGLAGATNSAIGGMTELSSLVTLVDRSWQMMKRNIAPVDEALTGLNKVARMTADEMSSFTNDMFSSAQEIGVTADVFASGVQKWVEAGYAMDEALDYGRLTAIGKFVGEGINSAEQMQKYLHVAKNAWGDAGVEVIDMLNIMNETSNNFPVSMEVMGKALQRGAVSAQNTGASFQEFISLVVAAQNATQLGGEKIGTAINAMSVQLPVLAAGFTRVAQQQREFLSNIGVEIYDEATQSLRSVHSVLEDLYKVQNDITEVEFAQALYALGGKSHAAVIGGILDGWDNVNGAIALANEQMGMGEMGSAIDEHARMADSVQFRLVELQTAWQEFWFRLTDDGQLFKDALDLLISGINALTSIVSHPAFQIFMDTFFIPLVGISGIKKFTTFLGLMKSGQGIVGGFLGSFLGFKGATAAVAGTTTAVAGATAATTGLKGAVGALGGVFKMLNPKLLAAIAAFRVADNLIESFTGRDIAGWTGRAWRAVTMAFDSTSDSVERLSNSLDELERTNSIISGSLVARTNSIRDMMNDVEDMMKGTMDIDDGDLGLLETRINNMASDLELNIDFDIGNLASVRDALQEIEDALADIGRQDAQGMKDAFQELEIAGRKVAEDLEAAHARAAANVMANWGDGWATAMPSVLQQFDFSFDHTNATGNEHVQMLDAIEGRIEEIQTRQMELAAISAEMARQGLELELYKQEELILLSQEQIELDVIRKDIVNEMSMAQEYVNEAMDMYNEKNEIALELLDPIVEAIREGAVALGDLEGGQMLVLEHMIGQRNETLATIAATQDLSDAIREQGYIQNEQLATLLESNEDAIFAIWKQLDLGDELIWQNYTHAEMRDIILGKLEDENFTLEDQNALMNHILQLMDYGLESLFLELELRDVTLDQLWEMLITMDEVSSIQEHALGLQFEMNGETAFAVELNGQMLLLKGDMLTVDSAIGQELLAQVDTTNDLVGEIVDATGNTWQLFEAANGVVIAVDAATGNMIEFTESANQALTALESMSQAADAVNNERAVGGLLRGLGVNRNRSTGTGVDRPTSATVPPAAGRAPRGGGRGERPAREQREQREQRDREDRDRQREEERANRQVNEDIWRNWDIELNIARLQQNLNRLSDTISQNRDNFAQLIPLLQQQQQYLRREIELQNQLRNSTRNELNDVAGQLRQFGFNVNADGQVTNLNHARNLRGDDAEEAERLLNQWRSLYEQLHSIDNTIAGIEGSIRDLDEQIQQARISKEFERLEGHLNRINALTRSIANQDSIFDVMVGALGTQDVELGMAVREQAMTQAQDNVRDLMREFNRLSIANIEFSENAEQMAQELENVKNQILAQADAIIAYQQTVNQMRIDRIINDMDTFNTALATNRDRITQMIGALQGGLQSGTGIGDLLSAATRDLDFGRNNEFDEIFRERISMEQQLQDALDAFGERNVERTRQVANAELQIIAQQFNRMLELRNDFSSDVMGTVNPIESMFGLDRMGDIDTNFSLPNELGEMFENLRNIQDSLREEFQQAMEDAVSPEERDALTAEFIRQNMKLQEQWFQAEIDANNRAIEELMMELESESLTGEQRQQITQQINDLEDRNIEAQRNIRFAIRERFEFEFGLLQEAIDRHDEYLELLLHTQNILSAINNQDLSAEYRVLEQIFSIEQARNRELRNSISSLEEQLNLFEQGSLEWNLINDQLEEFNRQLRESDLSLLNQNQQMLENRFSRIFDDLERSIFSGMNLEEWRHWRDTWIEGVELEMELEEMYNRIADLNAENLKDEFAILAERDRLSRIQLEYMNAQLNLVEAQRRLEELRNQRTIRRIRQREDGTFEAYWTYDDDAVAQAEQDILDREEELADLQEQALEDFVTGLGDLLARAEQGDFDSTEAFEQAIRDLEEQFGGVLGQDQLDDIQDYIEDILNIFEDFLRDRDDILNGADEADDLTPNNIARATSRAIKDNASEIGEEIGEAIAGVLERLLNQQNNTGQTRALSAFAKSPSELRALAGDTYNMNITPTIHTDAGIKEMEKMFLTLPQKARQEVNKK